MKTRTFIFSLLIAVLLTVLVLVFFLTQAKTVFLGRASGSSYNLTNSYVFASPLTSQSVSGKIRVTVFLLDDNGRGVAGKTINLSSNPAGLNFAPIQPETDKMGQAVFDVTSGSPGQFVVSAQVEGKSFPQTVTLRFQ